MKLTKAQRQHRIAQFIEQGKVSSQLQLVEMLADSGVEATQATVSRDLEDIGAVKVRASGGESVYAVPELPRDRRAPEDHLRRVLGDWVVEIDPRPIWWWYELRQGRLTSSHRPWTGPVSTISSGRLPAMTPSSWLRPKVSGVRCWPSASPVWPGCEATGLSRRRGSSRSGTLETKPPTNPVGPSNRSTSERKTFRGKESRAGLQRRTGYVRGGPLDDRGAQGRGHRAGR